MNKREKGCLVTHVWKKNGKDESARELLLAPEWCESGESGEQTLPRPLT